MSSCCWTVGVYRGVELISLGSEPARRCKHHMLMFQKMVLLQHHYRGIGLFSYRVQGFGPISYVECSEIATSCGKPDSRTNVGVGV